MKNREKRIKGDQKEKRKRSDELKDERSR